MKINETVGIDISKKTLDICIHTEGSTGVFENSKEGFGRMYEWYRANTNFPDHETMFVFEHTGLYSEEISDFLYMKKVPFAVVSGLEIKRSLGMKRGKSDKKDAVAIALYGYRRREELVPQQVPAKNLRSLKKLLALRQRLVGQRAGYKTSLKEQQRILKGREDRMLLEIQKKTISYLGGQISKIDKEMGLIVSANEKLATIFELITGIKGVGKQTALFLIVYTNGFSKFKNSRKFASYCGIAPFPNQSGTSILGKTRVSHMANKKIKSLLDLCAKSAIRSSHEMKTYYEKRVEMGKNKMSTINIVRNKLLARIFAVVKRGTPYIDTMKYAA